MHILLKNIKVIQPGSPYHMQVVDIEVNNGKITRIAKKIAHKGQELIESKNLHCSAGWVDVGTEIGEPGYEHREDIQTVSDAAAAGGYTHLVTLPNTEPITDNKSQIYRQIHETKNKLVALHPLGAISHHAEGKNLSEILDMYGAGAVGFTDAGLGVQNSGLLQRALEYIKPIEAVIVQRCEDINLSNDGQLHEGIVSTSLGLAGIPALAESSRVYRDLGIRDYTESKLLIHLISSKESILLLKQAKKARKENKLYSSVAYQNLIHTDEDLASFDSNYKVSPPLRGNDDKSSLINAVKEGIVDIISSNHRPIEEEQKKLEFPYAAFGNIGLQTCFSALCSSSGLTLNKILQSICYRPRTVFNIEAPIIEVGSKTDMTIFDPTLEWTYSSENIRSKSKNTPYIGMNFKGSVLGILKGNRTYIKKQN